MKQMIQCLYEYENGERTRNVGFVRIDQSEDRFAYDIHGNGLMCAEEMDPYIPPKTRIYKKIKRQDIARLPRKNWILANNSFLLHGIYNYRHLLYIEDGDTCWLGVPGVYHEKEEAAAKTFGFSEFRRITDGEVILSEEEQNTYEDFGYWCCQVGRMKESEA